MNYHRLLVKKRLELTGLNVRLKGSSGVMQGMMNNPFIDFDPE